MYFWGHALLYKEYNLVKLDKKIHKVNMMSCCRVCHNQFPSVVKVKYNACVIGGSNKGNMEKEKNKMDFYENF